MKGGLLSISCSIVPLWVCISLATVCSIANAEPPTRAAPQLNKLRIAVNSLNLSAGFETEQWSASSALPAGRSAVADLNTDGVADIVVVSGTKRVIAFSNPKAKSFTTSFTELPPQFDRAFVVAGQFACDEHWQTVLIAADGKSAARTASESEPLAPIYLDRAPEEKVLDARAADIDGDELADIVVLTAVNEFITYKNLGSDHFSLTQRSHPSIATTEFRLFDPLGAGISRIAYQGSQPEASTTILLVNVDKKTPLAEWAQGEELMRLSNWTVGDFNADGRDDILFYAGPAYRWWIAQSIGYSSVEEPVRGISIVPDAGAKIVSGDFTGDGQADLASWAPGQQSVLVARSRIATAIPGAAVRRVARTPDSHGDPLQDEDAVFAETTAGRFETTTEISTLPKIDSSSHRFQITDGEKLRLTKCRSTSLHAVGIANATDQQIVGQAIRIGPDASGPYVCTGFNPIANRKWFSYGAMCPENFAYVGADDLGGPSVARDSLRVVGKCCRLPQPDLLTSEQTESEYECPEESIAVGLRGDIHCAECPKKLVCRALNTDRYKLGPITFGRYFGTGFNSRWYDQTINEADIPLAIRQGIVRNTYSHDQVDGCLGIPFGSVLTSKGKRCDDFHFRQIQYRGANGDPTPGTPVEMFPDCNELSNPLSPLSGCRVAD